MTYIGVDPDLHNTAIAAVDEAGRPLFVYVVPVKKEYTGRAAVDMMISYLSTELISLDLLADVVAAVESQEISYTTRKGANPSDILNLGYVAASAFTALRLRKEVLKVYFPKPAQWKGQVPKQIHQARILTKLGWEFERRREYCVPKKASVGDLKGAFDLISSDWKHVNDAIGLALWAKSESESKH